MTSVSDGLWERMNNSADAILQVTVVLDRLPPESFPQDTSVPRKNSEMTATVESRAAYMFSSTPGVYQKDVDYSPPASPTNNCTKNPHSFDTIPALPISSASVAKEAVCAMGIPVHIVQMAIDFQRLEKGTDFENASQLFTAADDLIQSPQEQAKVAMKLYEAEQSNKKTTTENEGKESKKIKDGNDCVGRESSAIHSVAMQIEAEHGSESLVDHKAQLHEKVKRLANENHKLRQRKTCRACKKVDLASSGVTFLPCGHFITCESCAEKFDDCPACGKNILGTVRTFLS